MELAYLKSCRHMGQARVTCEGSCMCDESTLDGNQQERNSVAHVHQFYATQAAECVVAVEGASRGPRSLVLCVVDQGGGPDGLSLKGCAST